MLHYKRLGAVDKPTLVYIHGFLGSSQIYKEHIQYLANKYDIIIIDFAGHGYSASLEVSPQIQAYVDQIEEVLIAEDVKNATWIGHSMGGYIVL